MVKTRGKELEGNKIEGGLKEETADNFFLTAKNKPKII